MNSLRSGLNDFIFQQPDSIIFILGYFFFGKMLEWFKITIIVIQILNIQDSRYNPVFKKIDLFL